MMNFKLAEIDYYIQLEQQFDLAIPLNFKGPQPNFFQAPLAHQKPLGRVQNGQSCNFSQLNLIPHCNMTHTECIGHITEQEFSIQNLKTPSLMLAQLITVQPVSIHPELLDTYPVMEESDLIITRGQIISALAEFNQNEIQALIIRTLPNNCEKLTRNYSINPMPPYFSLEAMQLISSLELEHLIVDLPSIDRTRDGGGLLNHRAFWGLEAHHNSVKQSQFPQRTITEMAYIANEITDGMYCLDLQISAFESEAVPSRPILYAIKRRGCPKRQSLFIF